MSATDSSSPATPPSDSAPPPAEKWRTPPADGGYDTSNPLRIETPAQARVIDGRILDAWSAHPRRTVIESAPGFLDKLAAALDVIRRHVPACCLDAQKLRGGPAARSMHLM